MEEWPKLIVFDLDYTLWPFWVDTHVDPPFHKDRHDNILDVRNKKVKIYPEVNGVLQQLSENGCVLGVASRTSEIDGANQLLKLLDWDKYFAYKEIYPGCKVTHFERMKKKSGIAFKDMLFFDDELRNKKDLEKIGVSTVLVENGVSWIVIRKGVDEYQRMKYNHGI